MVVAYLYFRTNFSSDFFIATYISAAVYINKMGPGKFFGKF